MLQLNHITFMVGHCMFQNEVTVENKVFLVQKFVHFSFYTNKFELVQGISFTQLITF